LSASAFDTNVFAYAAGLGATPADRPKVALAEALLATTIEGEPLVVSVQVCLEFHRLLVRKGRLSESKAARLVERYTAGALIVPTDFSVVQAAFELTERHHFQTYDAVILASAARAECEILFSEDMQHGFEWQGVRIVNPFA
jgi:predicted nucleic acid-binding protein